MSSLINKFKQKLEQQTGIATGKAPITPNNYRSQINTAANTMPGMSKSKSTQNLAQQISQIPSKSRGLSQHSSQIQNISRKAVQPAVNPLKSQPKLAIQSKDPKLLKKKFNLQTAIFNPTDDLKIDNAAQIKALEREIEAQQEQHEEPAPLGNNLVPSIAETLSKVQKKLASAQAKMTFNFGNKGQNAAAGVAPISNFNVPKDMPNHQPVPNKHNADQLISTVDHSDIKNTQKNLFNNSSNMDNTDSTALMTTTANRNSIAQQSVSDNYYEASQFTLNILGESALAKVESTPSCSNSRDSKVIQKYQDTDEDGNRRSILPTKARPKVPSTKKNEAAIKKAKTKSDVKTANIEEQKEAPKNALSKLQTQVEKLQASKSINKPQQQRTNFVRLNTKNYKPRMRGGAFTNKLMAKKKNLVNFNERMKKKMQIENAKHRDQVNAYGGLGKVGLDHEGGPKERLNPDGTPIEEDLVPGFSASALRFVKKVQEQEEDEMNKDDDDLLADDFEGMKQDLEKIDEDLRDEEEEDKNDPDRAMFKIPKEDEGYLQILKEKFGHQSFRPGQLEAIKILLEKKENALVVLATGGGKSLVYQYVSLFLKGLVIIVTPLISLMTDQLGKLPDFLPGASLNSQQNYDLKKQVIKAIQDKHIKVLFISPEKFFIEDLSKYNRKISMVCVDEIHCASEWSHNFRPAYLKLHDMIKEKVKDDCVVLGLTATATKATQKSVTDIFNIKYPEHIVTEPNLSRMNLSLSITRDNDKLKALLALLASPSFKKLTSILIFATHKATCERLASHLNQNGINSSAYHAGKTDQQRQIIQKNFINNNIRVLVCTIAFSMGIDKSDIQSVIHYDMPKSIENYVQEIGRAGRDGKLARCHLFLNNEDFYLIRRLILTDILDNQNALKLTNKIIVEFKRTFLHLINPSLVTSKKRKLKQISNGDEDKQERLIEEFEHDSEIQKYYQKYEDGVTKIVPRDIEQIKSPDQLFLFLDIKETLAMLDLKKEVVLTMLNSLEKVPDCKRFFKLEGVLPSKIGVRFHMIKPEEMAEKNDFIRKFLEVAKEHQGVYSASTQKLAYEMNINPFQIPKILFQLQSNESGDISYETDNDSFVLRLKHIPSGGNTLELSQDMLTETRRIERNMIQKLNCMYFVARKVSLNTVDLMLKKEKTEDAETMYKGYSQQLNDLINLYFSIENEENMEIQIAGSEEERNIMMPLLYIDSHREKANVESDMKQVLREFHDQTSGSITSDPNERLKALDVVKILMGIYSDRSNVKRFANNARVWAKLQEYDYEDVFKVAQATVNQFYLDQICGGTTTTGNNGNTNNSNNDTLGGQQSKKRKLN